MGAAIDEPTDRRLRLLTGLVSALAITLVLMSAGVCWLLLHREPASSAVLAVPAPAVTETATIEESSPLVDPHAATLPPQDDRIYLRPFEPERPAAVVAPPLSDPARQWEENRPLRTARALKAIAILRRSGTDLAPGVEPAVLTPADGPLPRTRIAVVPFHPDAAPAEARFERPFTRFERIDRPARVARLRPGRNLDDGGGTCTRCPPRRCSP